MNNEYVEMQDMLSEEFRKNMEKYVESKANEDEIEDFVEHLEDDFQECDGNVECLMCGS